jgi:hypothetical protein
MWMPVCRKISIAAHAQKALRSSPANERRGPCCPRHGSGARQRAY